MSGQLERLLAWEAEGRQDTTDVIVRAASRAVASEKLGDLAPEMARLLVDAMALLASVGHFDCPVDGPCEALCQDASALLARFAVVEQKAGEGQ